MTLNDAQQSLTQLFIGGGFHFDEKLATISYEDYRALIGAVEPTPYEIAYDRNNVNYIEKLHIDYEGARVDILRKERSWLFQGIRVFELEITQVPQLILITQNQEPQTPKTLTTLWWVDSDGHVIAYRALYNDQVLEELGFPKQD